MERPVKITLYLEILFKQGELEYVILMLQEDTRFSQAKEKKGWGWGCVQHDFLYILVNLQPVLINPKPAFLSTLTLHLSSFTRIHLGMVSAAVRSQ